jgi:hypothetical protein
MNNGHKGIAQATWAENGRKLIAITVFGLFE